MASLTINPTEDQKLKILIRNCLIFSLFWHLVASWFSIGYHQYDEHYQILEFASYKTGLTPASALPWEFFSKLRPAIQPAFVVLIKKFVVPAATPETVSFLLRLFSSLLGFGSMVFILLISLNFVEGYEAKRFLVLLSTLLWFIPYIHSHFSAESISASLFFIGLGCIYLAHTKNRPYLFVPGGFLLGLALDCRLQTGFMIFGLALWCLFIARLKINHLLLIGIPVLIAVCIGILIDKWFYREWVFTMWNYLNVNFIQGKASDFGTSPWYQYFLWAFLDFIPPFSIFIIAGLLYSLVKYRANIFSITLIPFILAHIIVPHKESRFLFPMLSAVPPLITFAWNDLGFKMIKSIKTRKIILNIFLGLNILPMAISCFKPANDSAGLYNYLYRHYNEKNATLICKKDDPFKNGMIYDYYSRPKNIHVFSNQNDPQIDSLIQLHQTNPVLVLLINPNDTGSFARLHPKAKMVYCNIPRQATNYNYFHWVNQTKFWMLYEVKGEK